MIRISKNRMRELLIKLMELGLTNDEIAVRLNKDYKATEDNALSALGVAKIKSTVGLKGYKPKKKSLFEFVEEDEDVKELEFDSDVESLSEDMDYGEVPEINYGEDYKNEDEVF